MRNPVFYLEQRVSVLKHWTIDDETILDEDAAREYIDFNQPDPDESEEDDWDEIIVVDIDPGAFDYKVSISLLIEAENDNDAATVAADINNTIGMNNNVIENYVLDVVKEEI